MTAKLIQKHLLKGTQSFEIEDDIINIHIKSPFKEESLSVNLSVLDSEPVINKSRLDFVSRVNSEPLVSFYLAKPDAETFNTFINLLKQKIQAEYNTYTGFNPAIQAAGIAANSFDEPPEFSDSEQVEISEMMKNVDVEKIGSTIQMLEQYVNVDEISDFLAALKQLHAEPKNESHLVQLAKTFNALGPKQGAVLTYAPFINILLSDNPYDKF